MRIGPLLFFAATGWTALVGCRKEANDEVRLEGPATVGVVDTLALSVGMYEGIFVETSWSMPNNNSYSIDTVIMEVVVDSTLAHAINLVGVEEHMIVNPDLSLTLVPGSGYGGGQGYLVLGDSIVVERSQGALSWNFTRSFKGHKID